MVEIIQKTKRLIVACQIDVLVAVRSETSQKVNEIRT